MKKIDRSIIIKKESRLLLIIGSLIIIFQNFYILFNNITYGDEYIESTFVALLENEVQYIVDIVGFLLIGIAFYNSSNLGKSNQTIAYGLFIWVALRVFWQFGLLELGDGLDFVLFLFLLSNIGLFMALRYLYLQETENVAMLFYLLLNGFSSLMIFLIFHSTSGELFVNMDSDFLLFISFRLKLYLAPLAGMIAFGIMLKSFLGEEVQNNQSVDRHKLTTQHQ